MLGFCLWCVFGCLITCCVFICDLFVFVGWLVWQCFVCLWVLTADFDVLVVWLGFVLRCFDCLAVVIVLLRGKLFGLICFYLILFDVILVWWLFWFGFVDGLVFVGLQVLLLWWRLMFVINSVVNLARYS